LSWQLLTRRGVDVDHAVHAASVDDVRPAVRAGTQSPVGGRIKRLFDIAIATLALIALSPLMLAVALLIKLTMGGPVLFAHRRIGLNGKPFPCYKFRTMVNDAEERLSRYLAQDPHIAREWSEARKLEHDPRVTMLGRVLRKSSLDELPQLVNVLRGDMSCVGPRPVVAAELERYGASVTDYLSTRPGLTGLWQISGRNSVSYATRVALDSAYTRNWSVLLDLAIVVRTIPALLKFDETA
jgi:exopolysaccharide production protein ExoY